MKKLILIIGLIAISILAKSQCSSSIFAKSQCSSLKCLIPGLDVSVGFGLNSPYLFKNIIKLDVNYINKNNIVYGGSAGIEIHNTLKDFFLSNFGWNKVPNNITENGKFNDIVINGFIGYKWKNKIVFGTDLGIKRVTIRKPYVNNKPDITHYIKPMIGVSVKCFSLYKYVPITFGTYLSNAGFGITFGTIIN